MVLIDSNFTALNDFPRLQMDALEAGGELSSDIMVNLFKGYLAAPDKEISSHIKQKKDNYEDGQDLSERSL